jgi:hypothetical protein
MNACLGFRLLGRGRLGSLEAEILIESQPKRAYGPDV